MHVSILILLLLQLISTKADLTIGPHSLSLQDAFEIINNEMLERDRDRSVIDVIIGALDRITHSDVDPTRKDDKRLARLQPALELLVALQQVADSYESCNAESGDILTICRNNGQLNTPRRRRIDDWIQYLAVKHVKTCLPEYADRLRSSEVKLNDDRVEKIHTMLTQYRIAKIGSANQEVTGSLVWPDKVSNIRLGEALKTLIREQAHEPEEFESLIRGADLSAEAQAIVSAYLKEYVINPCKDYIDRRRLIMADAKADIKIGLVERYTRGINRMMLDEILLVHEQYKLCKMVVDSESQLYKSLQAYLIQ